MQLRQYLYADNSSKRILRCHQQCSSLARTKIHECELVKVGRQGSHDLAKFRGIGWLIWRKENAQQALAPTDSPACRVYTVVPVVFHVTVAAATSLGSRV